MTSRAESPKLVCQQIVILCLLMIVACAYGPSVRGQAVSKVEANLERGRQLLEGGKLIEASAVLEKVLKEQPHNKSARDMLITCYRFSGIEYYGKSDCHNAVLVWKKALVLDPKNQELKNFILRCESEDKAMAGITGDTTAIITDTSSAPASGESGAKKSEPKVRTRIKVVTDTLIITQCRRNIQIGVSSGIAKVAGTVGVPRDGFTCAGNLSIMPTGSHYGLRLEGTYCRFFRSADDTTEIKYTSVSGLSLEGVLAASLSRSVFLDYSAGVGIFEVMGSSMSETRRKTTTGLTMGLGLRKRLGSVCATLEGKYTHLSDQLSPDLVRISFGLSTY